MTELHSKQSAVWAVFPQLLEESDGGKRAVHDSTRLERIVPCRGKVNGKGALHCGFI
jgi:hypothetical protein